MVTKVVSIHIAYICLSRKNNCTSFPASIYIPSSLARCPRQQQVRLQRHQNPSSPKRAFQNCTAIFSRSLSSSPPLSPSLRPLLRNLSARPNITSTAVHTNQKLVQVQVQVLALQRQKRRKKNYRKDGRCLW